VGIAFLSAVSIASRPVIESTEANDLKERLLAGFKFIWNHNAIFSAIMLDLFAVLFGGAVALLPVFQKDILHVDVKGLGILRAAPAIGSIIMALWIAYRPIAQDAGKKLIYSVAAFGVCMILFGLSRNFWFSVFVLFLSGAFDYVSVIIRSILLQVYAPDNMKGRVSAVNNIFVGSSNEIGAFESGVAARLLGTATSVVVGGCMTLGVVVVTAFKSKSLRKLDI
jgi:hypothetical protein